MWFRDVLAAAPWFADRWRRGPCPDWTAMPAVVFNDKDSLQHDLLRLHDARQAPPVVHQVPSTADFYEAVRIGLGWGMLPEPQARADLTAGRLVRLSPDVIDVPLHWQRWRLDSPRLTALTDAVRMAAARHLLRTRGGGHEGWLRAGFPGLEPHPHPHPHAGRPAECP